MQSLKKTGTDFTSAQGMDPKAFFEVMGMWIKSIPKLRGLTSNLNIGLQSVVELDAQAGGKAFEKV